MNSKKSTFAKVILKAAVPMFFAPLALAPIGYAGGTISSGEPDDLNIKLEMTIDEIDAWEARVSVKVLALDTIPDVTLRIATGGVAKIKSPGFQKQTIEAAEVMGLPAKEIQQLKIGAVQPRVTNLYTFLLPFDQAGQASVLVTAFAGGAGMVKSVYVHRMFIAEGKKIFDGASLLPLRIRALEEQLRSEGLSEANIQERVERLQRATPSAIQITNP